MYERALRRRLERTPRSVLLLGPRQVGKSTLLDSLNPDLKINLASPSTFRDYVSDPGQLEREIGEGSWLVAPVDPRLVLETPPDAIWSACLHAMGIDPSALVVPGGGEN